MWTVSRHRDLPFPSSMVLGLIVTVDTMARKSKNALLEAELEAQALEHFEEVLTRLPDPRRAQGRRYPLSTVVVTALMAMVCGADDAQAMQLWAEANEDWLRGFLEMPHGVPSQDVYLAVFAALNPEAFGSVYRAWVDLLQVRKTGTGGEESHLAVDGKTSRRSYDTDGERPAIHTVSAWLADNGLVLGQLDSDRKTNEIKTIPALLKLLDLQGVTVTIDAMGCQTEIAETIIDGGGHYLLAVKENQPTLYDDIVRAFGDAMDSLPRPLDQKPPLKIETWAETNKGHGRIEEREIHVCYDRSWLTTGERWKNLAFIAMITSRRTELSTDKTTVENRYYIGSQTGAEPSLVAKRIRDHWGIENSLHWVLDVAFF